MRTLKRIILAAIITAVFAFDSTAGDGLQPGDGLQAGQSLKIGWAEADITPSKPVLVAGQFHARLSEGVMDPVTATVLAIESVKNGSSVKTIMISCDLVGISDGTRGGANLRDKVRELLVKSAPGLKPEEIIINATHTHAAPLVSATGNIEQVYGVSLDMMAAGGEAMQPGEYIEFAAGRIAEAAGQAWAKRAPGGISFGLGQAVVGHNRLQVRQSGDAVMYGNTNDPEFSHIEGYEDHGLNLLYTWNTDSELTGMIINIACPSQVSEHSYKLSGDFWHDTKTELRARLGKDLFVLGQVSAAGDQSPHIMIGGKAEERMQHIMELDAGGTGRGTIARRKQIALEISDAVTGVLPYMKEQIEWDPPFAHRMATVELSRRLLGPEDLAEAEKEAAKWEQEYQAMLKAVKEDPQMTRQPRWYTDITVSYSKMKRGKVVKERYELEKTQPKMPVEVHVIRIGDAAFATNPFELYLDYGMQMKARSPAVQTFVVQLTGSGSYLPTQRSIEGGAYGAVPASTLIGPQGGRELVEKTLELLNGLWTGE